MITHIKIQDFAIINLLDVDFHPGLNVITGETGAGKSIIIEAISTALGSRADTSYVRTGKDKAVIQLTLDTADPQSQAFFEENGIAADDESVIRREITKSGKSVCRINGDIVPVSLLNRFCRGLADIHGQYDHQSLLNADNHIHLLDSFGGPEIRKVLQTTSNIFQQYTDCSRTLSQLRSSLADAQRQRDFMRRNPKRKARDRRGRGTCSAHRAAAQQPAHLRGAVRCLRNPLRPGILCRQPA